jgi:plastocyanin
VTRPIRTILVGAAALLALGATPVAEAATYHGYVSSSISLRNAAGARVSFIPAGRHTFIVHDRSRVHNFALARGSTLLRATSIRGRGTTTWRRVRITRGRYVYFCTDHPQLRGRFRAG